MTSLRTVERRSQTHDLDHQGRLGKDALGPGTGLLGRSSMRSNGSDGSLGCRGGETTWQASRDRRPGAQGGGDHVCDLARRLDLPARSRGRAHRFCRDTGGSDSHSGRLGRRGTPAVVVSEEPRAPRCYSRRTAGSNSCCPETVTARWPERPCPGVIPEQGISLNRLRPVDGLQLLRHLSANSRLRQFAVRFAVLLCGIPGVAELGVMVHYRCNLTIGPLHSRPTARTRDQLASSLLGPPVASRRAWSASCAVRT